MLIVALQIQPHMCRSLSYNAPRYPSNLISYVAFINQVIDDDHLGLARPSLWRPSVSELYNADVHIHHDTVPGGIRAACFTRPDSSGEIHVSALAKALDAPSQSPRDVVAIALVNTAHRLGRDTRFLTHIRIYPAGWRDKLGRLHVENKASRKIFEDFRFIDRGPEDFPYIGDTRDAHLITSLEPCGTKYCGRVMASTSETLDAARDFLFRAHRETV